MAKFGINDILNAKTKAAGQQAQTEGYKEIYLSPYEVKAAQENTHQKLENIEELADSFLHVGQEQPTVLARVNGEYRIIDGHRRNAANILNLERGHKEYEKVLYRFMDMSEARAGRTQQASWGRLRRWKMQRALARRAILYMMITARRYIPQRGSRQAQAFRLAYR